MANNNRTVPIHRKSPIKPTAVLYRGRLETRPVATVLPDDYFANCLTGPIETAPPNPTTPAHVTRPKTPSGIIPTGSALTNHFQSQLPSPGTILDDIYGYDSDDDELIKGRHWPSTGLADIKLEIDQKKSRVHICKKRCDWPKEMIGSNSIDGDKLDPSVPITEAEVGKVRQGIAEYKGAARDAATRGDLLTAKAAKDNAIAISKCLEAALEARMVANKKRVVTNGENWIAQEDQLKAHADPELFVGRHIPDSVREEFPFLKCRGWDELDFDEDGKPIVPREERALAQLEIFAKVLENRALFMVGGTSRNCQAMLVAADDREEYFP